MLRQHLGDPALASIAVRDGGEAIALGCSAASTAAATACSASRSASSEINKACSGLSVYHPDKGGDPKLFRAIAQAREVLTTDGARASTTTSSDRRVLEAYGDYINYTYAPKTDWKLVVLMILLFLSVITHFYQLTLHNQQVASVRKAVMQNLGVGQGGSRETLALRKRALDMLEKSQSAKDAKKSKRNNNDQFVKIVDELIDEIAPEAVVLGRPSSGSSSRPRRPRTTSRSRGRSCTTTA